MTISRILCGILIGFVIGICYLCVTSSSMIQLKILAVGGWLSVIVTLADLQSTHERQLGRLLDD